MGNSTSAAHTIPSENTTTHSIASYFFNCYSLADWKYRTHSENYGNKNVFVRIEHVLCNCCALYEVPVKNLWYMEDLYNPERFVRFLRRISVYERATWPFPYILTGILQQTSFSKSATAMSRKCLQHPNLCPADDNRLLTNGPFLFEETSSFKGLRNNMPMSTIFTVLRVSTTFFRNLSTDHGNSNNSFR